MRDETETTFGAYRRLWRDCARAHWKALSVSLFFMVIVAATSAAYSKAIQLVINGFETSSTSVMYWGPAMVIALTTLKGAAQYFQISITNRVTGRIDVALQSRMYDTLIEADLTRLASEPPAALATRFSSDIRMVSMATKEIISGLTACLIVIATFIVMLTIDWKMTLILIVVFAMALFPMLIIGRRVKVLSRRTQASVAAMTSQVSEGLSGIRMARTYQLERPLSRYANGIFEQLFMLNLKAANWKARVSPVMELLAGWAVAVLLFAMGWRMLDGATTLADFMALLTGLGIVSSPVRRLGGVYATTQQGRAALERIYSLFDAQNIILDANDPEELGTVTGALSFEDVSFLYPDGHAALSDISLDVPAGSKVAFVGRSGAGKSSLFNLIPRLYDPSSGAIRLDGTDIRQIRMAALRNQIAVVGQDSVLLSGTVADNIGFGRPDANRDEIEAAAEAAAATDFITALPEGFDTMISPTEGTFSGGERQRLSIARAILRDAPVLLLDEPTSALDAHSEASIRAALDRLSEGRTTLVIAHRLATILDADMIVVMEDGRIMEQGTHEELLARGALYADLYRLQFRD